MDFTERPVDSATRYEGIIVNVRMDTVELANGDRTLREVVEHPGGVTVIPVDDEGAAYCVRQYRYPFGKMLLEAPAGKLEPGEEPRRCAERELSEETGISAGRLDYLGSLYPSPGFCTEVLHIFLARDLRFGEAHPDLDELLCVERLPLSELIERVMSGELSDAKTIAAVFMAERFIEAQGG